MKLNNTGGERTKSQLRTEGRRENPPKKMKEKEVERRNKNLVPPWEQLL
jgi:hypothetical protein